MVKITKAKAKIAADMVAAFGNTTTISGEPLTVAKSRASIPDHTVTSSGNKLTAYEGIVTGTESYYPNATNQAEDARGMDKKTKNSHGC